MNVNPEGLFKKQQDPLSPYSFVIVMEVLGLMLRKAENLGWICNGYDTLLLCETDKLQFLH